MEMMDNNTSREPLSPPEITEAYQKARRSYGLFSGLLIAWELIGIEIKEAPFQNFNVILKSPGAPPFILIALVAYFAFRITIEWFQCDLARRKTKPLRLDFLVAHFLGAISVVIYIVQRAYEFQIVDSFINDHFMAAFFIFILSLGLCALLTLCIEDYRNKKYLSMWLLILLIAILLGGVLYIFAAIKPNTFEGFLYITFPFLGPLGIMVILNRVLDKENKFF